jgi:hypothetical protein
MRIVLQKQKETKNFVHYKSEARGLIVNAYVPFANVPSKPETLEIDVKVEAES